MARPVDPQHLAENSHNLVIAQQLAVAGKLPDGSLNPAIYGSTNIQFDLSQEMTQMTQFNTEEPEMAVEETLEANATADTATEEAAAEAPLSPTERLRKIADEMQKMVPGAPTFETLTRWKTIHGDVFLLNLEEKIYIFRYLKRQEWLQLKANDSWSKMSEEQQEDHIFDKCVLFPRLDPVSKASLPAGIVSLIAEQVRIQSLFLDPVHVANITLKL
jgi:hypothetical protein